MDNVDARALFARYPHIEKKVLGFWGSSEGRAYLVSLINDTRDGSRAGFPFDHASTIMSLIAFHDKQFPQFNTSNDIVVPFKSVKPHIAPVRQQHTPLVNVVAVVTLVAVSVIASVKFLT